MNSAGKEFSYNFRRCKICGELVAEPLYRFESSVVYACRRCDFHYLDYLDDPPGKEDCKKVDETSWAYIEERLGETEHLVSARLGLVRSHCSLAGSRCLDVGAGTGQFLLALASEGASSTSGIETSSLRRDFASRRFGLFLMGDTVEELSKHEGYIGFFDMVTLWDVLEHVNFPAEALSAVGRILRPGGLLFLDTPSRRSPAYRLSETVYRLTGGRVPLYLPHFYSPVPFGHKQIFHPDQLARLAEGFGLEVIELRKGYWEDGFLKSRDRIVLICRKPNREVE